MLIGIVGHAADKFTAETQRLAWSTICRIITDSEAQHSPVTVVSGGCHLGGVDQWAEEAAIRLLPRNPVIHRPRILQWGVPGGYKERNLLIARDSDVVHVVVVNAYPPGYTGMRFEDKEGLPICYHCQGRGRRYLKPISTPHVKSGACWTALEAKRRGKEAVWHVI